MNPLSEKEKMLAGQLYNAGDPQLTKERNHAHILCQQYNQLNFLDYSGRKRILTELLASFKEPLTIEPPFYCDYGKNIQLGKNVYMNTVPTFDKPKPSPIDSGQQQYHSQDQNREDKLISLLEKGLITREDFLALVGKYNQQIPGYL